MRKDIPLNEKHRNLTPANVYSGMKRECLSLRKIIKQKTMKLKRAYNLGKGGFKKTLATCEKYTLTFNSMCPECFDYIQNKNNFIKIICLLLIFRLMVELMA